MSRCCQLTALVMTAIFVPFAPCDHGAVEQPAGTPDASYQTSGTPDVQDETDATVLFDGQSLDGWSGDERFWSVVDGAIVGQTTADNPTERNTFLIWQGGEVDDFELRFKYRMQGGNSGLQFRSVDKGEYVVNGYQADFDAGNNYTGILYEEGGRGILVRRGQEVTINEAGEREVSGAVCDEAEYVAGLKPGDWNEVIVTARGNRLSHSINGTVSAVLIDNEQERARSTGILALQLHAGPPMKIEFKDISLTRLNQ